MTKRRGAAKLAQVIDRQAQRRSARKSVVELGTITTGLKLALDGFGRELEPDYYLVDERFTQPNTVFETTIVSGGSGDPAFEAHKHAVLRTGTVFRPLAVGDRVVCLLLDADSDEVTPIVIGRLV